MKKNNKAISLRGIKRATKNKARKKRANALKEFNESVAYVKARQQIMSQLQAKAVEPERVYSGSTTDE
jgi:hypothetical protein